MGVRPQEQPFRSERERRLGKKREAKPLGRLFRAYPLPPRESLSARLSDANLFRDDSRETIRNFVKREAHGNSFHEKLVSLYNAIGKIPSVEKDLATLTDAWANRSAVDILQSKRFFAVPEADPRLAALYAVQGCMEAATALVATGRLLAKMEGVNARFLMARERRHVYVRATFPGADMLIDAQYPHAIHLTENLREHYAKKAREGDYAEGEGPRVLGIRSLHDFFLHDQKRFDQLRNE